MLDMRNLNRYPVVAVEEMNYGVRITRHFEPHWLPGDIRSRVTARRDGDGIRLTVNHLGQSEAQTIIDLDAARILIRILQREIDSPKPDDLSDEPPQ